MIVGGTIAGAGGAATPTPIGPLVGIPATVYSSLLAANGMKDFFEGVYDFSETYNGRSPEIYRKLEPSEHVSYLPIK